MKNILLTGCKGQLGQAIIKHSPKEISGEEINIISTSRTELNLLKQSECESLIQNIKPEWVINTAAYTFVDKSEEEEEIALKVNAYAPKVFCSALKKTGGNLLQISTDYVFDGRQGYPYKTNSKRNPINIYGKSKSLAEDAIENILFPSNQGKIVRTSWLYGPFGENFLISMLKLIEEKDEIKVVSDQVGSPTSTFSLANACWTIIKKEQQGINLPDKLHWTDAGVASWFDIAASISDISHSVGLIKNPGKIIPIDSSSYPSKAKRPKYSVLDCFNTRKELGLEVRHWQLILKDLIQLLAKNK